MRSEARLVDGASVTEVMADIGLRARAAARSIAVAPSEAKTAALHAMAAEIRARAATILTANAEDVADAGRQGLAGLPGPPGPSESL